MLQTCCNYLLVPERIFGDYFRFSTWKIMLPMHTDIFTVDLLFPILVSLHYLEHPEQYYKGVMREGRLALILIIVGNTLVSHNQIWCYLYDFYLCLFIILRRFPCIPRLMRVCTMNVCCILPNVLLCLLISYGFFFCLLIWWITLIGFWMLKYPWLSGINPTWSRCILYQIWFANIFWLMIFAPWELFVVFL